MKAIKRLWNKVTGFPTTVRKSIKEFKNLPKNEFTKMPKEYNRRVAIAATIEGGNSLLSKVSSFFLKLGKNAIKDKNILGGIVLLVIYFTSDLFVSGINLLHTAIKNRTDIEQEKIKTLNSSKILLLVRNKVLDKDNSYMTPSKIFDYSENYIKEISTGLYETLITIFEIIGAIIMFVGVIKSMTTEIDRIDIFIIVILITVIVLVFCEIKENKLSRKNDSKINDIMVEEDSTKNDIMNTEPINKCHASFLADCYAKISGKHMEFGRKLWQKERKYTICRTAINCLAIVIIFFTKIHDCGLEYVNLETVADIIAIQSIYNKFVASIGDVIRSLSRTQRKYRKIIDRGEDVREIFKAVEKIQSAQYIKKSIYEVPAFKTEYKGKDEARYHLENKQRFWLSNEDVVILTGPTGSGKSTLLKLLTSKIDLGVFKEKHSAIVQQADAHLGSQSVLDELTLGDESYDEGKLTSILKGLHLYEEIKAPSNESVLCYLKHERASEFSTGQQQRFQIARMLYNIDDSVGIIAFDEATSALNDAIAEQVMNYIAAYCKGKLLLMATHQVNLAKKIATKHLEFVADENEEGTFQIIER